MPFAPNTNILLSTIHEKLLKKTNCKNQQELIDIIDSFIHGSPASIQSSIKKLDLLCKKENSEALYLMGIVFQKSIGICIDDKLKNNRRAYSYFVAAAKLNHPLAIFQLGIYHEYGIIVDKDLKKAFEYYQATENLKEFAGSYAISHCYSNGVLEKTPLEKTLIEKTLLENPHDATPAQNPRWAAVDQMTKEMQNKQAIDLKNSREILKLRMAQSVKLTEMAAVMGHREAQLEMGGYFEYGIFKQKNISEAITYYHAAAEKGSLPALQDLKRLSQAGYMQAVNARALCYQKGRGMEHDLSKAINLLKYSIKNNYQPSLYNLGYIYYEILNNKERTDKGWKLLKQSAECENIDALYLLACKLDDDNKQTTENSDILFSYLKRGVALGDRYAQRKLADYIKLGRCGEVDYKKAFELYILSANQGNIDAQLALADFYENGLGVPKDIKKSLEYLEQAVFQGDMTAHYKLAAQVDDERSLILFKAVANDRDAKFYAEANVKLGAYHVNILKDDKAGCEYYRSAANVRHNEGQFQLGLCYFNGIGVEKDLDKAYKLFLDAANNHCIEAQYHLAINLLYNTPFKQDVTLAVNLLHRAINRKHAASACQLAILYENGSAPFAKNMAKAIKYYTKSAKAGDAVAKFALSNIYRCGTGVKENNSLANQLFEEAWKATELPEDSKAKTEDEIKLHKSFNLYQLASDRSHAEGAYRLGLLYENGIVSPKNDSLASNNYEIAATCGHAKALARLMYLVDLKNGYAQYYLASYYIVHSFNEHLDIIVDLLYASIPDAKQYAIDTLKTLATRKHPRAQYLTGKIFIEGNSFTKNDVPYGFSLLEEAAMAGSTEAQLYLAFMNLQGIHMQKNEKMALNLFQLLAKAHHPSALYQLGKFHFEGLVVPKDLTTALKYYHEAADYGNVEAMCWLNSYNEAKEQQKKYDEKKNKENETKKVKEQEQGEGQGQGQGQAKDKAKSVLLPKIKGQSIYESKHKSESKVLTPLYQNSKENKPIPKSKPNSILSAKPKEPHKDCRSADPNKKRNLEKNSKDKDKENNPSP